jgi:hypothetical protein
MLSTEEIYIRSPIAIETMPAMGASGNRDSFPGKGQKFLLHSLQIDCVHTQANGFLGPFSRG